MVSIARYSTSIDDLETLACFLDFQKMMESSMKISYYVVDCRVYVPVAQSESQNVLIRRGEEAW